jgi:hypothetical protein
MNELTCYRIARILGWGTRDLEVLDEKYLTLAEKLGIEMCDIGDDIERWGIGERLSINWLFESVIDRCFYAILEQVEERYPETQTLCEKARDSFNPYINYMDSWFHNRFDELDFTLPLDELIDKAKDLLVEADGDF